MQSALDILQTQTVSGLVQSEIVRMIRAGEISAGTKLTEATFVERLKISRPSIREAFRALEEAGLVRSIKNRGVFVRELSIDEAAELYIVRAGLDETAGRILAPNLTAANERELDAEIEKLENIAASGDLIRYFDENIRFHDTIIQLTKNTTLLEFYRRIINRMHLIRQRNFSTSAGLEPSCLEHRQIVDALRTRDPDVAALAMRQHVENGYRRLLTAPGEVLTCPDGRRSLTQVFASEDSAFERPVKRNPE